ncbi:MAG: hypothetical protein K6G56_03580 [Clostridiales bacterium]|nr:hypothetical protein [Clostridiales bacterium]
MAGIIDAIKNLFVKGEDKAEEAVDNAEDKVEEVKEATEEKVEEIKEKAGDVVEDLKDKAGDIVEDIKDKIPDVGEFFESLTEKLPVEGEFGDQVKDVIGNVRANLPTGLNIGEIINKIIEALKAKFFEGDLAEKIKPVIEFLKNKIPL